MTKTRTQIYLQEELNTTLNNIIGTEIAQDRQDGKPERTRNQIAAWILNLGIRTWQETHMSQNNSKRRLALDSLPRTSKSQ